MYYELNPNSPFFAHMQNTAVEQQKTHEEKLKLRNDAACAIVFSAYEGHYCTEDEQNYIIYAFINDVDHDVACSLLLANGRPKQGKSHVL